MAIKKFITRDYFESQYKSPIYDKILKCEQNGDGLTFDYLAQQASETIFDHISYDIPYLVLIENQISRQSLAYATSMLVEHYYKNGTNFAQIDIDDSTGDVSKSISWLDNFDPSIVPNVILSKLANVGLYKTLASNADGDFEFDVDFETIFDEQILTASVLPEIEGLNQLDINDRNVLAQRVFADRLDDIETDVEGKVDIEVYERDQDEQDDIITSTTNTANQNRQVIEDILATANNGTLALQVFQAPDNVTINNTFLNLNPDIKVSSNNLGLLSYTQEENLKVYEIKNNGNFSVVITSDITSPNTLITLQTELIDYDNGTILDTSIRTFNFTNQQTLSQQNVYLNAQITGINGTTTTKKRLIIRTKVQEIGSTLTTINPARIEMNVVTGFDVINVLTTNDVNNLSYVEGSTSTEAFNTLNTITTTNKETISEQQTQINNKADITYVDENLSEIENALNDIIYQLEED